MAHTQDDHNTLTLSNAQIILGSEVIHGTLRARDGVITDIDQSNSTAVGAIDCGGDFVAAGLIELHTDNLERHMQPRPGVHWSRQAAVIAHDAELASTGITTVFDALRVGSIITKTKAKYGKYARPVADEILKLQSDNHLRISHFLHLRAEVCSETLLDELAEFTTADRIGIVSIMDHTPGQRQFRDMAKLSDYLIGKNGFSDAELQVHLDHLHDLRRKFGTAHERGAVAAARTLGAIIASHDDTTTADVAASAKNGANIAEFPTTSEAAQASHAAGIAVMMGAPNLLRGASHSGNIAASELAELGVLDVISSDYVPAALLMAAVRYGLDYGNMAQGLHRVTSTPATAANLTDRGQIAVGKRADLVRFALLGALPSVKGTWSLGKRVC